MFSIMKDSDDIQAVIGVLMKAVLRMQGTLFEG